MVTCYLILNVQFLYVITNKQNDRMIELLYKIINHINRFGQFLLKK